MKPIPQEPGVQKREFDFPQPTSTEPKIPAGSVAAWPGIARGEAATALLAALLASGRVGDREAAVGLAVEWADRLLEKLRS